MLETFGETRRRHLDPVIVVRLSENENYLFVDAKGSGFGCPLDRLTRRPEVGNEYEVEVCNGSLVTGLRDNYGWLFRKSDQDPAATRITCALDLRSLHGPRVDVALGVVEDPPTVVDEWETGARTPTWEQVVRLAELTDFLPAWFYGSELPEVGPAFICGAGLAVDRG